jgi:hypothetical protein
MNALELSVVASHDKVKLNSELIPDEQAGAGLSNSAFLPNFHKAHCLRAFSFALFDFGPLIATCVLCCSTSISPFIHVFTFHPWAWS